MRKDRPVSLAVGVAERNTEKDGILSWGTPVTGVTTTHSGCQAGCKLCISSGGLPVMTPKPGSQCRPRPLLASYQLLCQENFTSFQTVAFNFILQQMLEAPTSASGYVPFCARQCLCLDWPSPTGCLGYPCTLGC